MPPPQVGPWSLQEPPSAAQAAARWAAPGPSPGTHSEQGSRASASRRVPTLYPRSAPRPPSQFPQRGGPHVASSSGPRGPPRAHPPGLRSPAPPTVQRGRNPWSSGRSRGSGPRPLLQRAKSFPSRGPGASAWSWLLQQARGPLKRDSCTEKKNQPTALKWGVEGQRDVPGAGFVRPATPLVQSLTPRPPSGYALYPRPLASCQPRPCRAPPLLPATPFYSPGQVVGFPALSAARRPRAQGAQGAEAGRGGTAGGRALQPPPPPSCGGSRGWWRLQPGISALASAATASIPLEEFLRKAGPEAGIVITESLRRAAVVPGPALGSGGSFMGAGARLAG